MTNILEVKNLNKYYKDFHLENINFNIPAGSIVGLIGKNGSGKTTTIKSILNISKRNMGDVSFFGLNLDENYYEIKKDIGVVLDNSFFQDSLNPKDIDSIMKDLMPNWDANRFFYYLNKFDLDSNKSIKNLSKGMKLKLNIATCLSHNAKFLILDEPTAGLDPVVRNEILDELMDFIQDENKSILFSTHITTDLDKIADYIIFLDNGKLIFYEDRETLLSEHGIVKCSLEDMDNIDQEFIVKSKKSQFGFEALIKNKFNFMKKYPNYLVDKTSIEDIMLFHIKGE